MKFWPSFYKTFFHSLFLAVLGLCCCTDFSLVATSGGFSLVAVLSFSLQQLLLWSMSFTCCSLWALEYRLSSCGSWTQLLPSMWIFPDQGSNPCLLPWKADSLPLSHQGSPRNIFERRGSGKSLSRVQLFVTPMDCSPPGSFVLRFSRQEYWSGLPFPPPRNLHDPGNKNWPPALQAYSLPSETLRVKKKKLWNPSKNIGKTYRKYTYSMNCV